MSSRRDTHTGPAAGLATQLVGGPPGTGLLVVGGAGAGRTTLARAIAAVPPAASSAFLPARPGAGAPLWLARELVRLLADLTGGDATRPADTAAAVRQVRQLLDTRRTGERTHLLVIDDVDLAEPASAYVLTELLRAPGAVRLALTARTDWPDRVPPGLAAALAELPRHELTPLDLSDVTDLTADILDVSPAERLAADLLAATGGNPAALRGVLDDAVARQAVIVIDDQAWSHPGHRLALPDDHVLPHRVDELPRAAVRAAELIAVAGPRPGLPTDALAALRTAGVLTGTDDDPRPAIPVLADALCVRAVPWHRSEPQADVLAALTDRGGLVALAAHATRHGHALRPTELRALRGGHDTDAVAAALLSWCGPTPPADVVSPAIRHWARIGNWPAIAALPTDVIPADSVVDRVRSVLLTRGHVPALSDVDDLARRLANETCDAVRDELVGYGPAPEADPPDSTVLAVDDTAWRAWSQGRWDDVVALAVADRLTGRTAHSLCTAEESAALAADVWMNRGRPELARRWLDDMRQPPDDPAPRPLAEWARAGLDLLLLRPEAAAARLAAVLTWMAENRQHRYRHLLAGRRAFALAVADRLDDAAALLTELAIDDGDRLMWLRERVALADYGGAPADRDIVVEYLTVARQRDQPFDVARAQLALGTQTSDVEQVLAAANGFAELGATLWQAWAMSAANALGVDPMPSVGTASVDELVADLVAVGLSNADIAKLLRRNEMYVKRQVSRLLRATRSRHRTELVAHAQPSGPRPDEPADPVAALLAAGPVATLVGPAGPGRGGVLIQLRKALANKELDPAVVLALNGWTARRDRRGVAAAVLQALAVAVPEAAGTARVTLSGTDRTAIADAVVGVLRTASRTRPIVLLLDDADALADEDRAPVGMLAAAADERFGIVVAAARQWPELADLTGPPVRLPSWGTTETAAALARRDGPTDPATVEAVRRRTAGDPGAVQALLRAGDDPRTAVLDPSSTSPLRELLGRDATNRRWAALLAALDGPRLPMVEPAANDIGLPVDVLRPATERLLENGLVSSTSDGRLGFGVPLFGDSVAATADPDDLRAVHRALAVSMLAEHEQGLPVEYIRLGDHIAGTGADIGQPQLVEFAERVVSGDPARAQRWCAALLAAAPADPVLAGRAAAVSARALYDLARFQEAAIIARRALDLLPEQDTLTARTTLINSLLRIGDYDDALDVATDDGETPRSVPDGLQKARILLLQEQFDAALDVLFRLRPANRMERIALVTGVRMLAAIGADGGAWQDAEERTDPELSPLTKDQVDTVRQALAWGDLYTSERAIMPGTLPSPAARRRPPPSLARLSAAVDALREGRWSDVLALAKENEEERAETTFVDGILPALAAEVLARRGRPAEAESLLEPMSTNQPFGHLIGWATGTTLLARDEPGAAIDVLAATDDRSRTLGYLTGRELVLARWVDACLAAGDRKAAIAVTHELGELANQVNSTQAQLHWLVSHLATQPDERTIRTALPLADMYGDRLLTARIRLYEGELGNNDALRTAHADFRQLGAADWQRRAAELMTARGISTRVTETINEADRRLIDLIASGATNQEAASTLGVSEKAVEARLTRLYRRTGLRSRVALVREYGTQRDTA